MCRVVTRPLTVSSIKVRLVLSEKRLDWESRVLNLHQGDQFRPEYLKLNPNAVVPTLVDDERAIIESSVIIQYLDERFPEPPLMPSDSYLRAVARGWMKRIDDLHGDCAALTFAIAFRRRLANKTAEELDARFAAIPNEVMREQQRKAVALGIRAPHVVTALRNYVNVIAAMEDELGRRPYLAGDTYTLADAAATPYLNRTVMLGIEGLWRERRPKVAEWFDRMRQRPSFDESITKAMTDVDRQNFDVPREESWEEVRRALEAA